MLTFGWEVGLALGFVGPVDHQVPEAAETVGDLICKSQRGKTGVGVIFPASVVVPGHQRALYADAGAASISAAPVLQVLN